MKAKITISIILITLLYIAMDDMPYGYYQFIRLATTLGMIWIAKEQFDRNNMILGILSIGVVLLFNPVIKVIFDKDTWMLIDFSLATLLLVWLIVDLIVFLISKKRLSSKKENQS